jgi:SPP1 gp7 family putative phage head morphogenesis protein
MTDRRAVLIQRIIRSRDMGFVKLTDEFATAIYHSVYNDIEVGRAIAGAAKLRSIGQESLDDMFDGLNDRLMVLGNKLMEILFRVMRHGGRKIMDTRGNVLKLQQPKYDEVIKQLRDENMSLVRDMAQEQKSLILDEIERGIRAGNGYNEIAKQIQAKVKDMVLARAALIATTESARAHGMAMSMTMQRNGISEYHYLTAGDDRVSQICRKLSYGDRKGGKLIRYKTGEGPLPVKSSHPRCRCVIVKSPNR